MDKQKISNANQNLYSWGRDTMNLLPAYDGISNISNIINITLILIWLCILVYLYQILISKETFISESKGSSVKFFSFISIIAAYPFLFFITRIIHYQIGVQSNSYAIPPDYGICMEGPNSLTDKEKQMGAVAKLNYKCKKEQQQYSRNKVNGIIDRVFYIIYALFTLVLFFSTSSAGRFKNTILKQSSQFIMKTLQLILFLTLMLLTAPLLQDYNYLSLIIFHFYDGILQITGALVIILITYLLTRLIYMDL